MRAAREMTIAGSVQGVGFRWTAKRIADDLGLSGWVRNNADGGVSLVLEGADEDMNRFMDRLNDALGQYIVSVKARDVKPGKNRGDFDIVR